MSIENISQETTGTVSLAIGGGGTVWQMVAEVANTAIIFGNLALVLGGLYLMIHKIVYLRRKRKEKWDKNDV